VVCLGEKETNKMTMRRKEGEERRARTVIEERRRGSGRAMS
jgi:hypothetical protein